MSGPPGDVDYGSWSFLDGMLAVQRFPKGLEVGTIDLAQSESQLRTAR
jgi:hypothetical protein